MSTAENFKQMLASLPPNVNPYTRVATYLEQSLLPNVPQSLYINLYINIALYSICVLVTGAGLYARWQKRSLWFFQLRDTEIGRLIMPNTTVLFASFSGVFALLGILEMVLIILAYEHKISNTAVWTGHIWLWPWMLFAIWEEAHGMAIALALCRPHSKILGLFKPSASLLNAVAILQYPIHFALITPPFVIIAQNYKLAHSAIYDILVPQVETLASSWSEGDQFQVDASWLQSLSDMSRHIQIFIDQMVPAWSCHLVIHAIIALAFFSFVVSYMTTLRQKTQGEALLATQTPTVVTTKQVANAQQAFRWMFIEVIFVSLTVGSYCGLAGWLVHDFEETMKPPRLTTIEYSVSFWLFGVFGLIANALVAMRSLRTTDDDSESVSEDMKDAFGPLSLVEGINVLREEVVTVEVNPEAAETATLDSSNAEKNFFDGDATEEPSLQDIKMSEVRGISSRDLGI